LLWPAYELDKTPGQCTGDVENYLRIFTTCVKATHDLALPRQPFSSKRSLDTALIGGAFTCSWVGIHPRGTKGEVLKYIRSVATDHSIRGIFVLD
jgi:hypothetical protein